MSGFPTRPSRAAFGPKPQNRGGIRNPAEQLDADTADLAFWQIAGCSGVADGAWALLTWNGVSMPAAPAASFEAWDPNGEGTPTVGRTGTGVYTVTYAASYPDKDGIEVTTNIIAAKAFPQTASDVRATVLVTSGRIVTVYLRNAAGAAVDASVLVEAKLG